jgi:GNAT superfamily N-acetyltransferase
MWQILQQPPYSARSGGRSSSRFSVNQAASISSAKGAISAMDIRRIRADEGLRLRDIRLRALADSPMAYGSTLAREQAYPEAVWHERAANGAAADKSVTFVADHDNRLVAMATGLPPESDHHAVSPTPSPLASPMMVGVYVDGGVRRQGIGVELVAAVIEWARARGWARLRVWITSGNAPALALYRRCGFRATGATRPNAHTPGLVECELAVDL